LRKNNLVWGAVVLGISTIAWAESSIEESLPSRVSFTSTDHLIVANRKDPGDPGAEARNSLMHENSVRVDYSVYSLGIHFTNKLGLDPQKSQPDQPFTLEKKMAVAEWEQWDLRLGDSHQELGRGLALSLYRDDVFGLNTTLEGAAVRFRPEGFDAQAFAGRLNALKAPVAVNALSNPLENRTVYLAGGSIGGNVTPSLKSSAHYFMALNQPINTTDFDKRWHTFGATINYENVLPGVDFYGESNVLLSQLTVGGQTTDLPRGNANYVALAWANADWRVKLEGKDYRDYNFEFRRPPTLEEDLVETTNLSDVSGARLGAERRFDNGRHTASASYLAGYDREVGSPLYHGVVGTKFVGPARSQIEIKGGYRWMPERNNLAHASIRGKIPTTPGQSLELGARRQYARIKLNVIPATEDRSVFDVTYNFSERFNLMLGYELVPSNEEELGRNFVNVGATAKIGTLTARAFIGQTSGGTLCSGGVCRQVPAYTGALLETSYLF